MKIRIISIACLTTAAVLLAACTAVYKNSDACEQLMRSKLAESSQDTLKVSHKGVGIYGSRVIVEGSIEHVQAASEVAAASAASAVQVASAAKAVRSASGAGASSSASSAAVASGTAPGAASNAAAASSPVTASLKSAKPRTTSTAAAAECTFHGSSLAVFSWLAPANLASPPNPASEATE